MKSILGQPQIFSLCRYNFATYCLILLKFITVFGDHFTANTLQVFDVKDPGHKLNVHRSPKYLYHVRSRPLRIKQRFLTGSSQIAVSSLVQLMCGHEYC